MDSMETARSSSKKWMVGVLFLALFVCACSPQDRRVAPLPKETFPVDDHCYLNAFDPAQFPWKEADCLNYEEVFKNHTYFEVRSDSGAQTITVRVRKFVRGKQVEAVTFIAVPDRGKWTLQVAKG